MVLLSENDGLKWVDFADALAYYFDRFYKFSPFLKVFNDKEFRVNSLLLIYIAVTSIPDFTRRLKHNE